MRKSFIKGLVAGLVGLAASVALAAVTYVSGTGYTGWNPVTQVFGMQGVFIDAGGTSYATTSNSSGPAVPALVVSGTSCALTTPIVTGGLSKAAFTHLTATTGCTVTVTNLPTVGYGYICRATDVTTPADTANAAQTVVGVNGCTVTLGTIVSGDAFILEVSGV